ncbi:histidine kinase [Pedobacter immunditicola]|uniref:histidine kinase n=1 Tax=Pedobacter immunditicola TaxID=3133440 RepID=UPI003097904A
MVFTKVRHYGSLVLFQFFVVSILVSLIGHIIVLYTEKRKKEQEIEELTIKSLQSRYDALTNQINPHFFFNSLNGLTSLIRKKNDEITLTYVSKLSDVFAISCKVIKKDW